MDFVIESDLGHDPDDFFCLCHLVEAGHKILALGLVPGSPEQVNLAAGFRKFGYEHLHIDWSISILDDFAEKE